METIRKYHNSVKRALIESSTKPGDRVLDVGCGFGGDLGKWERVGVTQLDACDPSEESLLEATNRAPTFKKLKPHFFHGDIFSCPKKQYDVVCYNFSLHYIFGSRELFFKSIKGIRSRMKDGSVLIGCVPDSESILMSTPFEDFFKNTAHYESKSETRKFFNDVKQFYNLNDDITNKWFQYSKLNRLYIFQKK
jgi:SAM-dependent methyltransferase